ncbi:MAG: hypothetical protein AB7O21_19970 [Gammaproteobacteria bacterium]
MQPPSSAGHGSTACASRPLVAALIALVVTWWSAAVTAADPLADARSMLGRLSNDASTGEFAVVAREFGNVVDAVRQGGSPDLLLLELRKIADQMRDRAQARLRAAEAEAGDDEGALEQIYESATWDNLSFALSAFPYWRAWIDLTLAERPAQKEQRDKRLWQARRGFRAASMQIFQPSLVYGGWLGMGYVSKADGQTSRAMQIFEALKKALAADPAHPVYKMVEAEMSLMRGEKPPEGAIVQNTGGDSVTANLHAEAMMLLAKHRAETKGRDTGSGAREAAERLRRIIDAGNMTMAILGDVLQYQAELAREGLSTYTDLLLAEYNFNNQQWFTAVQKYRAFFQQLPQGRDMNFDRFRYRYAVALLKSDVNGDAAREAEKLLRAGVDAEVQQAATKLAYIARARNAEVQTNDASRAALATAAKRFLARSPNDADADGARLLLAQQSGESGAAMRYLDGVKSSGRFAGGVQRTRFYVIAKDFAEAAQKGSSIDLLARQALSAWEELPADEKKPAANQAFFFQLLAVTDPNPEGLLKRLEVAEQKNATSGISIKRSYLWSRLKIYERIGQPERLLADIQARGSAPAESWVLEQYYPFLRRQNDVNLRLQLAEALEPQLDKQPEMERRIRLQKIDDLLVVGRGDDAYAAAQALVKDYPRAGDAYRMLARAAQETRRLIEADNAWRIITEKVPPKQDIWWEGMLARIDIRAGSTRPEAACELVATVSKRLPAPKPEYSSRFATLRQRVTCPGG